ncbi:MAG: endonuclease NucS domain-containing protein [Candidatus Heimdallarchaeota archaeon]
MFTEQNLRNLIIMHSSLIEKDLSFIKVEVPIESAVIDLIFQDRNGNHLLLEVKLNANDRTIGQVMRYNIDSYAATYGLKKNKIRRGVVTISTTGQILQACEANNIELFVLKFQNVGFVYK